MEKKISHHKKKMLRVLCLGDSNVGKTTFLTNYCSWVNDIDWNSETSSKSQSQKVSQTIGCDVHVCYHSPNVKSLLSDSSLSSNNQYQEEHLLQFWDLAGENKQREFVSVFTRDRLQKLDAIIFFFDMTNLKTFRNIYRWLVAIFHNNHNNKNYACVWNLPFLLIGTKSDQIPKKYVATIKVKLLSQLNRMFRCTRGENLLFMNAHSIDSPSQKVELSMFNLFLSELCIEKSLRNLQKRDEGQSEFAMPEQLPMLNKDMQKYRLNSDNYKNKRVIEESKNFVQIVMEVNQLGEYKKAWLAQVVRVSSGLIRIKERMIEFIFSKKHTDANDESPLLNSSSSSSSLSV